jgi:hypothetical protein
MGHPRLPATIATHWGFDGTPNGFSSWLVAVAIVPPCSSS